MVQERLCNGLQQRRSCFCQLIRADYGCILISILEILASTPHIVNFLSFFTVVFVLSTFAIALTSLLPYLPALPLIQFLTCNEQFELYSRKLAKRRDGISDSFIERCTIVLLQCRLSFPFVGHCSLFIFFILISGCCYLKLSFFFFLKSLL